MIRKIGMGGGCHWCTEAVFQSLKGVVQVEQGYIASTGKAEALSEAVIITYLPEIIPLETLIEIHLHTHESTSDHSFRKKYRSAIYTMEPEDELAAREVLTNLQREFSKRIITMVLPFQKFEPSRQTLQDYYFSNPKKPFCQRYIEPKLQFLLKNFAKEIKPLKLDNSTTE